MRDWGQHLNGHGTCEVGYSEVEVVQGIRSTVWQGCEMATVQVCYQWLEPVSRPVGARDQCMQDRAARTEQFIVCLERGQSKVAHVSCTCATDGS